MFHRYLLIIRVTCYLYLNVFMVRMVSIGISWCVNCSPDSACTCSFDILMVHHNLIIVLFLLIIAVLRVVATAVVADIVVTVLTLTGLMLEIMLTSMGRTLLHYFSSMLLMFWWLISILQLRCISFNWRILRLLLLIRWS